MKAIKRILMMAVAVVAVALCCAAKDASSIKFSETKIDLGQIQASQGKVTFSYKFENVGTAPLIVVSVSNGGCGCTRPSFPKEPIAPGKGGTISITFDPTGRSGELNREVSVRTNGKPKTVKLRFSGVVIPAKR